jgi:hypothetical protein
LTHFHLPKPLHGWSEILGEIDIIALGVMMAVNIRFSAMPEFW